eukprot:CAMPEP_0117447050 /NCGR_PEP_ID=MMETSP0759-20121206/6666_1 /TAXON_ID=63605 /ORGANISM="Percolomonas cosmopolitus, Strain WS" /LENGTH=285 /DNA_ID=CAMNT_0005239355 /DNA_START=134 /DNA_END=991 /DNA_ORIENTATION=+
MLQELQLLFWPLSLLTIIIFSIYFYFFWNLIPSQQKPSPHEIRTNKEALNKLYEKAVQFDDQRQYRKALDYFLAYLHGFNEVYRDENSFPDTVVKCMRRVTKICRASGEYGMALQFLQAEKFLYENALVNQAQIGEKLAQEAANGGVTNSTHDAAANATLKQRPSKKRKATKKDIILQRADALEKLSELMLKEKKLELAVSYASKALQLRQQASNETKQEDMDQFIKAYAELGRETYKRNLKWYEQVKEETEALEKIVSTQLEDNEKAQEIFSEELTNGHAPRRR